MKPPTLRALALVIVAAGLLATHSAHAQGRPLAITGATLIDGTGAPPREGVAVFIRDGVIEAITDAAVVPEGAEVIDAAGKYVIPGLADMHVHFGTGGVLPSDSLTVGRVLRQFLFYGVTTVLNVGATNGSLNEILALRRRRTEGGLLAPHVYATGGLLTVPGSHPIATIMSVPEGVDPETYEWTQRGVWVVRTPAEVRDVVARLADAGMDGIKVIIESGPGGVFGDDHPQMPLELVRAAVEEATRHGLSVFAHATSPDELEVAVEAGVRAVVHLVGPEPVGPGLLAAMRGRSVYYVPTLSLFVWADAWGHPAASLTDPFLRAGVEGRVVESLLSSPMAPTAPPAEEDWVRRRGVLQALEAAHDAGVPIAVGTDTANPFVFPGYSVHHELELMVEAGLTPMEALVAAARRAAEMLGEEDAWGTIEPGMRADLLVLSANPLEDIRNTRTVETVVVAGEVIDRSTLLSDNARRSSRLLRSQAAREEAVADTVLVLAEAYNAAWEALSPEDILAFHADDLRYYYRGDGQMASKAAFERVLREEILPAMQAWSMEAIDPHVEVLGPDAAVVSFTFDADVIGASGQPFDYGSGALTYVFERRSGAWKIVLMHESAPVPE